MTKTIGGTDALMAHSYVTLGYKDYVAARSLLRGGHLLQGVTVASTAVKKYLKAVLLVFGARGRGHLDHPGLWTLFQSSGADLVGVLNHEFIHFLGRAYRLRYVDDLKADINLGIEQYKVLAELDFTISAIEGRLTLQRGEEPEVGSVYQIALKSNEPALCDDNYVRLGIDKRTFVERRQKLYAVYVTRSMVFVEVERQDITAHNDGVFSKPEVHVDGDQVTLTFSGPVDHMLNQ